MTQVGLAVEQQAFDCLDWQVEGLELDLDGAPLPAHGANGIGRLPSQKPVQP